jgi:membrane complex biogenesis BtpA family protein
MLGFARSPGIERVIEFAVQEARTLERAGFTGILLENEGDRPHPLSVSDDYRHFFTALVTAVKAVSPLQVGLEILYDMVGTVRVGIAARADFVRLDVFTDDTEVRWGIVRECTGEVAELRQRSAKFFPQIWADVHVKHGRNLTGRSLSESTRLAVEQGANVLIVSGTVTGEPPTVADCREMRANALGVPVVVGSGFSVGNAARLKPVCDGAVVATSVQAEGRLNLDRCTRLVEAVLEGKAGSI